MHYTVVIFSYKEVKVESIIFTVLWNNEAHVILNYVQNSTHVQSVFEITSLYIDLPTQDT